MTDTNTYYLFHETMKNMPDEHPQTVLDQIAVNKGISFFQAAVEAKQFILLNSKQCFPKVDLEKTFEEMGYTNCNIVPKDDGGNFVRAVAASIKFPVNTAYLHFMTCVAAAMNPNFSYRVYGNTTSPVTLYAVSAQPPSTGKSGIHSYFTAPILQHFDVVKERIREKRKQISIDLKRKQKDVKQATGREEAEIEYDIEQLQEELETLHEPVPMTDDATPEALQQVAGRQGNWFNILSPEADILNVMFGSAYGDGKKANHGLLLKAWDNEYYSGARITRTMKNGHYRGNLGVLAQDEAIKAVLAAGEGGRGLSERILLMRERPMLGERDHTKYTPVPKDAIEWYSGLIENLVTVTEPIVFEFSENARQMVNEKRNDYEQEMGGNGKYSNKLLQGMMGKAGAQIFRVACILHVTRDWWIGGRKSVQVDDTTVVDAINIYDQLSRSNVQVASGEGYAGEESLKKAAVVALRDLVDKRKTKVEFGLHHISMQSFRDLKKGGKPFNGHGQLTSLLRDELLPSLARTGVIAFHDDEIWINPNILN